MSIFRAVLISVFVLLSMDCQSQNADIDLLRTINLERNEKLDPMFVVITHSDGPISIALSATLLTIGLIKRDSVMTRDALMITGSLVVSSLVTTVLKWGIGRDRPFVTYPDLENSVPAGSPSFPSGHTSMAFSTATSLTLAYPKWYVYVPAFLWAGAVGYSRMHLGVHYPSDVFVGALIGTGSAFLSSFVTDKLYAKRRSKALRL